MDDILESFFFFPQDQKAGLGNSKTMWTSFHSSVDLSQVLSAGRVSPAGTLFFAVGPQVPAAGHKWQLAVVDSAKILQLKPDEFHGKWIISQLKKKQ